MIEIYPINYIDKVIVAPPSKSLTNRALIIASLAEGTSIIKNVCFCDDTGYLCNALSMVNIHLEKGRDYIKVENRIKDRESISIGNKEIYLGNSGTAMRFFATFASLIRGDILLKGNARMNERPIKDLLDGLHMLGVEASSVNNNGCPPLCIKGKGKIHGGKIVMSGKSSSQYLSSILLCAPYADKEVEIIIKDCLTSKPYIDITISLMRAFSAEIKDYEYKRFIVSNKHRYRPREIVLEGDASNASYFFAAAAILDGKVKITGLNYDSPQGDIKFVDILGKMGCKVIKGDNFIEVSGKAKYGVSVDMNSMPDMVQTLAVVAAFVNGKTEIKNISNLSIKETNRILAIKNELSKIGAKVYITDDTIWIEPGVLKGATIETYDDHRMAMAFSIAGLKIPHIIIKNPECVSKSFPQFFDFIEGLSKNRCRNR